MTFRPDLKPQQNSFEQKRTLTAGTAGGDKI